jgi:hypothetical protein
MKRLPDDVLTRRGAKDVLGGPMPSTMPSPPSLPGSTGQPIMPRDLLLNERFVRGEGHNGSPDQVG